MKQRISVLILVIITICAVIVVSLSNDKLWQCEYFLSRHQMELEKITEYVIQNNFTRPIQEYSYKKEAFPIPIREAMEDYFINVHHGRISVRNSSAESSLILFDITDKAYRDDIGDTAYEWYSLCYTSLDLNSLENRLSITEESYSVFLTNEQNWYIIASCHE